MFYHLGFVIQFLEKYCAYSASFPLTLVFIQVRWVFLSDASASLFGASGFHFHSCYCAGQHNWTFVLQFFSYIPSTIYIQMLCILFHFNDPREILFYIFHLFTCIHISMACMNCFLNVLYHRIVQHIIILSLLHF